MMLFHGLSAFNGTRNPLQQLQAVQKCMEGIEICAADRPIGEIGIMVRGEIIDAYPFDVWSTVKGGKRVAEFGYDRSSINIDNVNLSDPVEVEKWIKNSRDDYFHGKYCEVFMKPRDITHIWLKPYASKKAKKVANILSLKYSVPVVDVKTYTRPWEIVGHYYSHIVDRSEKLAEQAGYIF